MNDNSSPSQTAEHSLKEDLKPILQDLYLSHVDDPNGIDIPLPRLDQALNKAMQLIAHHQQQTVIEAERKLVAKLWSKSEKRKESDELDTRQMYGYELALNDLKEIVWTTN